MRWRARRWFPEQVPDGNPLIVSWAFLVQFDRELVVQLFVLYKVRHDVVDDDLMVVAGVFEVVVKLPVSCYVLVHHHDEIYGGESQVGV